MFKKRARPQGVATPRSESPVVRSRNGSSTPLVQDDGDQDDQSSNLSETLEELIALRKLKRATGGIELDKLNSGERRKRRKEGDEEDQDPSGERLNADGTIEGTQGGLSHQTRGDGEVKSIAKRVVNNDAFTGQTNTVDVDKHMMAYIESELKKRKGTQDFDTELEMRRLDPRDELFQVAEKYRVEKQEPADEGSVTLSAAMLTAIPEIDLGIDRKLKNIEETEKAKRKLADQKMAAKTEDQTEFAADRFYRARRPLESDADALAKARREAAGEIVEETRAPKQRREMATDDLALSRFKQRQQQQLRK
ncbi:hypothetical protein OIO90_005969 [Microbotryomycetes sp. JL221]|nr:hypothetical protein OIO90_005969 [Microbotryomycetes sp. JL221]